MSTPMNPEGNAVPSRWKAITAAIARPEDLFNIEYSKYVVYL